MRYALIGLLMALAAATASEAAVNVSIGINIPTYPRLVAVPGTAVYYAPAVDANYFFYDGLYWVFDGDEWLASSWYNGPWRSVGPEYVPGYLWQVPVRYYRRPPVYFQSWRRDIAPRWGEHWGADWRYRHDGWDRRARYAPAPLPSYQRQYSGSRYPQAEQQTQILSQYYRYQPREQAVREQYRQQGIQQPVVQGVQRGHGRGEGHQGKGNHGEGNQGEGNHGKHEGRGHDR